MSEFKNVNSPRQESARGIIPRCFYRNLLSVDQRDILYHSKCALSSFFSIFFAPCKKNFFSRGKPFLFNLKCHTACIFSKDKIGKLAFELIYPRCQLSILTLQRKLNGVCMPSIDFPCFLKIISRICIFNRFPISVFLSIQYGSIFSAPISRRHALNHRPSFSFRYCPVNDFSHAATSSGVPHTTTSPPPSPPSGPKSII